MQPLLLESFRLEAVSFKSVAANVTVTAVSFEADVTIEAIKSRKLLARLSEPSQINYHKT